MLPASPYYPSAIAAIKKTTRMIVHTNKMLIHTGDSTHHHDHVILPSSFSVIKISVSSPVKPIPLLCADEELLMLAIQQITYNFSPDLVSSRFLGVCPLPGLFYGLEQLVQPAE